MSVSDAKRLKELEGENTRLKRLLANAMLENEVIKEALQKSGDRTSTTRVGAVFVLRRTERTATRVSANHAPGRLKLLLSYFRRTWREAVELYAGSVLTCVQKRQR